jgi:hypothetical protein
MRSDTEDAAKISFSLYDPFSQFVNVRCIWMSLLQKCPHHYFLSWGWVETWLKSLPPECGVSFVAGFKEDVPVIAFFVGCQDTVRHGVFRARRLSLNSTLIPHIDALCVEYNAILIDPDISLSLETLVELMPIKDWDEFVLPRCAPTSFQNLILDKSPGSMYNLQIVEHGKSYYVDLEKVRRNNMDYLSMVSKNKRQQSRRSLKEYEQSGDVCLHVAETARDAGTAFEKLVQLHQKEWTKRGWPGAFSDYLLGFHRKLIASRFEKGEIQVMVVSSGPQIIGCLYNLVYHDKVLFYQSGFNYQPKNVYRPGLVCHYLAVLHNAAKGLRSYDFLVGREQYKKSLSTDSNEMKDILVQKKKMKYTIENRIGNLYRFVRRRGA